jgi:hypothetical protein
MGWGETESTWNVGHLSAYCTSPGWRMSVEHLMEWQLEGEIEVLEENLPQFHSLHYKSHVKWRRIEPRPLWWEAGD